MTTAEEMLKIGPGTAFKKICNHEWSYSDFDNWLSVMYAEVALHTRCSERGVDVDDVPLYTVQKYKTFPLETFYGRIHASKDGKQTVCGIDLEKGNWCIISDMGQGTFDCPKCKVGEISKMLNNEKQNPN